MIPVRPSLPIRDYLERCALTQEVAFLSSDEARLVADALAAVSAAPPPSALPRYEIFEETVRVLTRSISPNETFMSLLAEGTAVYLAADVDARLAIADADWTRVSDELDQTFAINDTLRAEVVRLTRALEVATSPQQDT